MTFVHFAILSSVVLISALFGTIGVADDGPFPQSTDPRLKIELFAESPQIVTPTGIDVDHVGRVWAIESNTHFPPEGYQGIRPIEFSFCKTPTTTGNQTILSFSRMG